MKEDLNESYFKSIAHYETYKLMTEEYKKKSNHIIIRLKHQLTYEKKQKNLN